jgi:hypothetical protein
MKNLSEWGPLFPSNIQLALTTEYRFPILIASISIFVTFEENNSL